MKSVGIVVFLLLAIEHADAKAEHVEIGEILKAATVSELSATVVRLSSSQRRARGCQIQRSEGVPPTLCYPSKNTEALDDACLRTSRNAFRLPAIDGFTSPACRSAIEKREKDLAYASSRDALR